MFWPSFNSVLVDDRTPGRKLWAVLSTYLALAVSAVTAAAVSVFSSPKGKLNLVQFETHCITLSSRRKNNKNPAGWSKQNRTRTESCLCIRLVYQIHMQSCILAGGVAVGVSMSAVHQPWEAMTIGFTAAVLSTIGFRYLKV